MRYLRFQRETREALDAIRIRDETAADDRLLTLRRDWEGSSKLKPPYMEVREDGDAIPFTLPATLQVRRYRGEDRIAGSERDSVEYGPILLELF